MTGSGSLSRCLLFALLVVCGSAIAAPMDSFNAASGYQGGLTANLFRSILYAGIALFGVWSIATAISGWIQGRTNPLALFFIVSRSAMLLVLASLVVGAVT